jgi:hypothetical protein
MQDIKTPRTRSIQLMFACALKFLRTSKCLFIFLTPSQSTYNNSTYLRSLSPVYPNYHSHLFITSKQRQQPFRSRKCIWRPVTQLVRIGEGLGLGGRCTREESSDEGKPGDRAQRRGGQDADDGS